MTGETQNAGWEAFLSLCVDTKSTGKLEQVLKLFLTHEERAAIADRYLIVKELLRQQKTQREIAADLGVSIAKITRGSNCLKELDDATKALLAKCIN